VLLARVSMATAMMLVGSSVVSARFIVESFPIMLALGIRQAVATVILLPVIWLVAGGWPRAARRDHGIVILQTLTGVVLFNILLLIGVDLTTAATAGIITSTVPAAIAVISRFLGERISRPTMLGIALAIGGVLVVNVSGAAGDSGGEAPNPVLGGILVFGAVVCEALFTILGRNLSGRMTPTANCFLVCFYGMLMFAPFAIWSAPGFDFGGVPASGWVALAWSTGPVMIGAFFLWFSGLRVIPASSAAVFTSLIPISAVACSAVFLGERLGWAHAVGTACVIAAIVLVSRSPRTPAP
jgi:drug/metabolite transporter (DMT)-like permease